MALSSNRAAASKSLQALKLAIVSIRDITPIARNGCRLPGHNVKWVKR